MPGDDEALRQELLLARSVSHPNVCRVHDLAPSPWGPILVMEHITGQTLHTHIRRKKAQGGYTCGRVPARSPARSAPGVAAIHAQGLVHGDLKPGNVMVDRTSRADHPRLRLRAGARARSARAPRRAARRRHAELHVARAPPLAAARAPRTTSTRSASRSGRCGPAASPSPATSRARSRCAQQIMFDVPAGLSIDEVKQIFRCLARRPAAAPAARHLRFFNPTHAHDEPDAGPARAARSRAAARPRRDDAAFAPGAQSLLVTFATNAPEFVGQLFPLDKPRDHDRPPRRPGHRDPRGDRRRARTRAALASRLWIDRGHRAAPTAPTPTTATSARRRSTLMHGGEVQLGESRLKLVSFHDGSPQHKRARAYLGARRAHRPAHARAADAGARRGSGASPSGSRRRSPIARYELRGPNRHVSDRPTILEMLALRRAAQRVVELTEMLLLSIVPVTAGRTGPLKFAVAMIGPSPDEARNVVEQVVSQVQGLLPEALDLGGHHGAGGARAARSTLCSMTERTPGPAMAGPPSRSSFPSVPVSRVVAPARRRLERRRSTAARADRGRAGRRAGHADRGAALPAAPPERHTGDRTAATAAAASASSAPPPSPDAAATPRRCRQAARAVRLAAAAARALRRVRSAAASRATFATACRLFEEASDGKTIRVG